MILVSSDRRENNSYFTRKRDSLELFSRLFSNCTEYCNGRPRAHSRVPEGLLHETIFAVTVVTQTGDYARNLPPPTNPQKASIGSAARNSQNAQTVLTRGTRRVQAPMQTRPPPFFLPSFRFRTHPLVSNRGAPRANAAVWRTARRRQPRSPLVSSFLVALARRWPAAVIWCARRLAGASLHAGTINHIAGSLLPSCNHPPRRLAAHDCRVRSLPSG